MKNEKATPLTVSSIKTINSKIKYMKLKQGINRDREAYENIRINAYCKATNSIKTIGRKKYKHTYPTTSNLEWKKKELEKIGVETEEMKYIRGIRKKLPVKNREETIILIDNSNDADVYRARINNLEREIETKIWLPGYKRKVKVLIERTIKVPEELLKIALRNGVEIFKLKKIM